MAASNCARSTMHGESWRSGSLRTAHPSRGFTLLEVLIAILLLALALSALVRLAGLEARASAHLRDRTLAQWVASNALAETRLREPFPAIGRREGEATMGSRRWRWRIDVQGTDEASIRRMEARVFDADAPDREDAPAASELIGFAVQR
jgi:general secretion pathway protein I